MDTGMVYFIKNMDYKKITVILLVTIAIPVITTILSYKSTLSLPVPTVSSLEQKLTPVELTIPVRYKIDTNTDAIIIKDNVLVTCYSNRVEETDDTPNITATGRFVCAGSCAVSQDMFRKTVHPGDLVYIVKLDRWFIVEDTTHPRHKKLIDIFYFKDEPKPFDGAIRSDVYFIKRRW